MSRVEELLMQKVALLQDELERYRTRGTAVSDDELLAVKLALINAQIELAREQMKGK